MLKIYLLIILLIFYGCKKDKLVPDIVSGMVCNISLDGNAYDSKQNISGALNNVISTSNRNGEPNKAMLFAQLDSSFVNMGDFSNYSFTENIFTINVWVKLKDTLNPVAILSKRNTTGPFEYSIDNHMNHNVYSLDNWVASGSGSVYGTDPLDANAPIQKNEWQMITYVADGNLLKVYLNGTLQSGMDIRNDGSQLEDTDAPFQIGVGGNYGVNYYFDGSIDDIKMYKRAFTEEEIRYLFET
jgi:hypothetical protein